ncbi:TCP-1/cpn60 chaperonin family protein [Methanohalobium sp.]|uniref:TCP-1/cpn60 chaperonin family protein n=1 Tax=Methanohalobium sp. TaxID=2837493 RepID=UPI0025F90A8F|nr:TCP-1/cpn60 chaperonin family protein [Methanohalobium sp.]
MMENTVSKLVHRCQTDSNIGSDSLEGFVEQAREKVGIENVVGGQEFINHLDIVCSKIIDLLSSSFGPRGLNKIILNPVNDMYLTSDGKTILEETDILHPVVTSLKDLAGSMDKTCGDGTKTAVLLSATLVNRAIPLINRGIHPTIIIDGYQKALNKSYEILQFESKSVKSQKDTYSAVFAAASSKGIETHQAERLAKIMIDSIKRLNAMSENTDLDLNDNVRIIKKTGASGIVSLNGVILDEKPARFEMPDYIESPNVLILNHDLKVDSEYLNPQHNINIDSFGTAYQFEECRKNILKNYADKILETGADLVFCEGEVDPYIDFLLAKNNILMFKKMKMKDIEKLSRATEAGISSIKDDLTKSIGYADKIEVKKENGEHLVYVTANSKMITTIIIWEPVKYNLEKVEEAADDALNNAAFILKNGLVVAGGGGIEFGLSQMLKLYASTIEGKEQLAVVEYAKALEQIPRILAFNMGMNPIDSIADMKYYYNKGIDSRIDVSGQVVNNSPPLYDSVTIKKLAIISATETATNILKIDEIVPKR